MAVRAEYCVVRHVDEGVVLPLHFLVEQAPACFVRFFRIMAT